MGIIDKVAYSQSCRQSGVIVPYSSKGSKFNGKLYNNISRARTKVKEYALSNTWDYFATLTIDKTKFDRYDIKAYIKALSAFLNNYNRNGIKVLYLLIPELHKDNAIHLHGLLSGIPVNDLIINENGYLDWKPYHDKFGYISLSPIKDPLKVSNYITKYISKDMATAVKECNAHLYYCSQKLKHAERIFMATDGAFLVSPDYSSDYSKIKSIDNTLYDFHDMITAENIIYDTLSSNR